MLELEHRKPSMRRYYKGDSGSNLSVQILCVSVGIMVGMGFLVYLLVLTSPALPRRLLQDVLQCEDLDSFYRQSRTQNFGSELPAKTFKTALQFGKLGDLSTSTTKGPYHHNALLSIEEGNGIVHCTSCECHGIGLKPIHVTSNAPIPQGGKATTSQIKILLGILTMASKSDRRRLLRMAYAVQSSEDAVVSVRFVLGKLVNDAERTLIGLENMVYGDIMVLNCEENLNVGKTFHYFSTVAAMGDRFDYVMKTDDDSYVRLANLGKHVSRLPRTDLYYGYILPCNNKDPYHWYMAGMGYLISWDLVEWIEDSPIPRNNSIGVEDELVASWFNKGGKAKTRVNDKPLFYDHPEFGGECSHDLIPDTILIHQVKTTERWIHVLSYFEKDRISVAFS